MIDHSTNGNRISSSLVILGEDLDPEYISEVLCIESTSQFKKGDAFSSGRGHRKHGMWCIERAQAGESFSDDLNFFLKMVAMEFRPLTKLNNVQSSRISIWIDVFETSSTFEFSIEPSVITDISSLGSQVFVTQFFKLK
jgi:hypothetical protein